MLIADINELKYQQEDAKKPNAEEDGEGKEDVTFLKLALKWVRSFLQPSYFQKLSCKAFTLTNLITSRKSLFTATNADNAGSHDKETESVHQFQNNLTID